MSIVHDGITLAVDDHHGLVTPVAAHELPIAVAKFFGVNGEGHIVAGGQYGRELVCDIMFDGYASRAALQAALDLMDSYPRTPLTGTVVQTIGADVKEEKHCTFIGFLPSRPPFLDGSGVHGWVQFGTLRWRQRKPNS